MPEPVRKITVCGLCERELKLNSQILLNGCPYCGSFKFKTFREKPDDEKKVEELEFIAEKEIEDTEITEGLESIRLTSDGIFEVDIEKLIGENDGDSPIISRNKDGSYYIKFQKEKDKDK